MSPASGLPTLRMAADDFMSPHMIAGHGAKPASAGAWAWAAATATADRLCEAGKLPARSGVARPVATRGSAGRDYYQAWCACHWRSGQYRLSQPDAEAHAFEAARKHSAKVARRVRYAMSASELESR